MSAGVRVLGGVAVWRTVAAQRRAALLTGPQMDPLCTDLHTLITLPAFRVGHGGNGAEMSAGYVRCHRRYLSLVEYLMYEGDRDRSLADGRRHALDAACPHVADREHAGQTRFEEMGSPG